MAKISLMILNNLKSTSKDKMEKAFNIIYNEYSYLVYYVALKIVKDKSLAEEITNETFLNFFLNKDKIDSCKNIKYYLVTTSKNLAINNYKYQERLVEFSTDIVAENKTYDHFKDYIDRFKDFLDEQEIDLIVLHLLYDYSFKEIANQYNVSINVISSKYRRVIKKVKQYYKGD